MPEDFEALAFIAPEVAEEVGKLIIREVGESTFAEKLAKVLPVAALAKWLNKKTRTQEDEDNKKLIKVRTVCQIVDAVLESPVSSILELIDSVAATQVGDKDLSLGGKIKEQVRKNALKQTNPRKYQEKKGYFRS